MVAAINAAARWLWLLICFLGNGSSQQQQLIYYETCCFADLSAFRRQTFMHALRTVPSGLHGCLYTHCQVAVQRCHCGILRPLFGTKTLRHHAQNWCRSVRTLRARVRSVPTFPRSGIPECFVRVRTPKSLVAEVSGDPHYRGICLTPPSLLNTFLFSEFYTVYTAL